MEKKSSTVSTATTTSSASSTGEAFSSSWADHDESNVEDVGTVSSGDSTAKELASMKKMLLDVKVDGKKSIWAVTLETFGMADGKNNRGDIMVTTVNEGLEILNDYISAKQATMDKPNALMSLVPLEEFNATQDQFLTSFLKWAEKEDEATKVVTINVSKARRRLDSYFEWMEENKKEFEIPLTVESILPAAKVWDIQVTYGDDGLFLWWIDLGALDRDAIRAMSPTEHLRYVVWFSHLVMFDKKAQDNGAMLIEDMGMMGFWKIATLVPHDVSAKMDRMTIGILPVRMKKIYVFGAATWMTALMTLMKPFMGKKMRERMKILPKKTDKQRFCDDLVTRKNIPVAFCGLEGEVPRDKHFERYKQQ